MGAPPTGRGTTRNDPDAPFQLPVVDDGEIPHPKRHEMGHGDGGAETVVTMGTVAVRRDPHGARGSRAAR